MSPLRGRGRCTVFPHLGARSPVARAPTRGFRRRDDAFGSARAERVRFQWDGASGSGSAGSVPVGWLQRVGSSGLAPAGRAQRVGSGSGHVFEHVFEVLLDEFQLVLGESERLDNLPGSQGSGRQLDAHVNE